MESFESHRLIMRPWVDSDAEALFKYAGDPDVGIPAGWPPHTSVEMSREVIRDVFSAPDTYAVVLKETDEPIGCCGIVPAGTRHSDEIEESDVEIGYWLAKPYWGRGIIPEAVEALIEQIKARRHPARLWIGLFNGNDKSRRVAEKCHFTYHHTEKSATATEHFYVRLP